MLYLRFEPARTSTLAFTPTCRVIRDSKHIATVTRGRIQPKRRLTKRERASIESFVVSEVLESLSGSPAIRKRVADAMGIV